MARVIDVRGSGGELVVMGGALTLPTSDNIVSTVLAGSLRYDPPSKSIQMFNGTIWAQATAGSGGGVTSFNGRSMAVTLLPTDISAALGFVPLGSLSVDQTLTISGGTSTSAGILGLAATTINAGTYTFATISVDAQGRLIAATANSLFELSAKDPNYGALGDGVTNDTGAILAWLGAVITTGRPGYLPPGRYRCNSQILLDVTSNATGFHIFGAGGEQSILDLTNVTTIPAFQLTCSSGPAFYQRFEGITILTNVAGIGMAVGLATLADTFNGLQLEAMVIQNLSPSALAVGLQMNSCYNCEVSATISCAGHGDALQLTATKSSVFHGAFSNADTGVHLTTGPNVGNIFTALGLTLVNTCVVIDNASTVQNTFLGGQFVWNTGSGSIAAINASAGNNNRFIANNFVSPGAITLASVGIIVTGHGIGQETFGGLAISPSTGNSALILNSPSGSSAYAQMQTAGLNRWQLGHTNTAELGTNSGSDFALSRYSDTGALIDTPIGITRATGTTAITRLAATQGVGFFGASITTTQPIVSGSQGSGAALASLLAALATLGLVVDTTTGGLSPTGDVANIKAYGADPTGTSDSTVAIRAAVAAGKDVLVPDGTYLISGSITLSATGQTLSGTTNAIFKKTGTSGFDAILISGNNIQLIGLSINGNNIGVAGSGIGVKGSGNLVEDCTSYNNPLYGIYKDGTTSTCTKNRILDNYAYANGGVGIASNSAPDNITNDNQCWSNNAEGMTNDALSYRCVYAGNKLSGNCITSGVANMALDQASGAVITGNTFNAAQLSRPGLKIQNSLATTSFCTMTGNTFTDNTGGGLYFYTNNSATGGPFYATNNVATGNNFQNNTGFDIQLDTGCIHNDVTSNGTSTIIKDTNPGGSNPKGGILCSFRAFPSAVQSNVTGDSTVYQVQLGSINFNNGTAWSTSANNFTAPVTGIYQFAAGTRLQGGGTSTYGQIMLIQTGSVSQTAQAEVDFTTGSATYNLTVADMFALQAGDTVALKVVAYGSTKTMSILANAAQTWLSGALVG